MKRIVLLILSLLFLGSFTLTPATAEQNKKYKPIDILYVDLNDNNIVDEHELLVVMSADDYAKVFGLTHKTLPLERMLRGQIDKKEYIALNHDDFVEMDRNNDGALTIADGDSLYKIDLAKVTGIVAGSYSSTQARKANVGKFKVIVLHLKKSKEFILEPDHTVHFQEGHSVVIKSTADHPHVGL